VRFLLETYGPEKMRALLGGLGDGLSPDESAQRAYGRSLDRLEDEWRTSLGLKPMDRGQSSDVAADSPAAVRLQSEATDSDRIWVIWLAVGLAAVTLAAGGTGGWLVMRRLR
jgi:hypothetical protein